MRKFSFLAMFFTAVSVTTSCEKEIDEQGQRITYYNNKTGEGYVFYAYSSDTLPFLSVKDRIENNLIDSMRPAPNIKIEVHQYTAGFMSTGILRHFDYVYTDNSGKYSFKLLKNINGRSVVEHRITIIEEVGTPSTINLSYAIQTKKGYIVDTLYIVRNTYLRKQNIK